MEAQRKHPNSRVDPQAERISRDSNVRYWLVRLSEDASEDGAIPESDRGQVLADLTLTTARDHGVHHTTVVRGINRAQRVNAVLKTKGHLNGY